MNPIETTNAIKDDYLGYLKSILTVKDNILTKKAYEALEESEFIKGPYLESTPPFVTGNSLASLIHEGLLSTEFKAIESAVQLERPLYVHQEQAFRKIVLRKRNVIVATGTGSGKTECYLYPIINELMKQKEAGLLCSGVHALLLYPMNALANDQVKRLRQILLEYPDITFGRYTGETTEKQDRALNEYRDKYRKEPSSNELISREAMRNNPPHILLTNYAMLEYLLLRPVDTELFDGDMAENWRFIVLDEAHTYKGANGTEIALLLRRLKERVCKKNKMQCIATSATLGNKEAFGELAQFATSIFNEPFEIEDIVTSSRVQRDLSNGMRKFKPTDYQKLKDEMQGLKAIEAGRYLYKQLINDERIIYITKTLELNSRTLNDVAERVFFDLSDKQTRISSLISLIELGVMAKPDENSAALLPARYHLFVRALEGMYVALYPNKKVFLDRKEQYSIGNIKVPVFELGNCQHCGQEYIIGKEKEGILLPAGLGEKPEYYMLTNLTMDSEDVDIDSDDEAFEKPDVKKVEEYIFCTACGCLSLAGVRKRNKCCEEVDSRKLIKVYKMKSKSRVVNTCASCGGVSKGIIKRFMTANQPATYVVANSLYSMIPAEKIEIVNELSNEVDDIFGTTVALRSKEYEEERGRKLLVFSDNRQEAAFFAAYMDNKYNQLMWRRLILRELKRNSDDIRLDDLIRMIVIKADAAALYPEENNESLSKPQKEMIAGVYVIKEYMGHQRQQGLEGRGYVKFYPEKLPVGKDMWGLKPDEVWELCCVIMDSFRYSGATTYPEHINAEDDDFAPRNRYVYFRKQEGGNQGSKQILSFLPADKANNKRVDYVRKILQSMGIAKDDAKLKGNEILNELYEKFIPSLIRMGYFSQESLGKEGAVIRLNYKKWFIGLYKQDEKINRCKRCGKITSHNIHDVCCEFRCGGILEKVSIKDFRDDPYYSRIYTEEKIIPMVAKEHTAQLKREAAGNIQEKFEKGEINVLSCSTTFEMGVDVGQLEAIMLRNVPPETSNYIQRAGRAGRRTSATAFSVTFARRNSHDLNYFDNPPEIINGKIKPPYIEMSNEKIALRHVNSIVFSWFFRKQEMYFKGKVNTLIGYDGSDDVVVALKSELNNRPKKLIESIEKVLTPQLMERLGIRTWSFVEKLIGEEGCLTKAIDAKKSELETLDEILKKRNDNEQYNGDVIQLKKTFRDQQSINFLASSGVLPKYGFPVDVVNLDILNNSFEAKNIDLSRDLRMAIAEFAPGSSVIAAGKVWKSYAINKTRDKGWPTYKYFECPECKRISLPDGITTIDEEDTSEPHICNCGGQMKVRKFIIPIFGFSTSILDKPKRVGENRPPRSYATRVQFWEIDKLDSYQLEERKEKDIIISGKRIYGLYSPQGKLVLMNRGNNGSGMWVCGYCGYAQTTPNEPKHKNKLGHNCPNTHLKNVSLGHIFSSDILRLEFPEKWIEGKSDKWISLLYAILEGAADALGISRRDINGCIDNEGSGPAIILFDEAVGGAGHVKRIMNQLEKVLRAAYRRVDGHCGCGEETTCYGCLRSYSNQLDHEELSRGMVKEYLSWLLFSNELSKEQVAATVENVINDVENSKNANNEGILISDEWKKKLEQVLQDDESYEFALDLIKNKMPVPDQIGYELFSKDIGVLGEAEMVWLKQKIAVLSSENKDNVDQFKKNDWKVFVMGSDDVQMVVEAL
ncbi:DEAD/DEAH box helicase [Clostridium sp.]|uniref:DEAD/DEAH box helicase n=1 Tax=Clostridium sp. TaxID=1506 RepID=UPI003D6CFCA3